LASSFLCEVIQQAHSTPLSYSCSQERAKAM
jgi:hypothetical protein